MAGRLIRASGRERRAGAGLETATEHCPGRAALLYASGTEIFFERAAHSPKLTRRPAPSLETRRRRGGEWFEPHGGRAFTTCGRPCKVRGVRIVISKARLGCRWELWWGPAWSVSGGDDAFMASGWRPTESWAKRAALAADRRWSASV